MPATAGAWSKSCSLELSWILFSLRRFNLRQRPMAESYLTVSSRRIKRRAERRTPGTGKVLMRPVPRRPANARFAHVPRRGKCLLMPRSTAIDAGALSYFRISQARGDRARMEPTKTSPGKPPGHRPNARTFQHADHRSGRGQHLLRNPWQRAAADPHPWLFIDLGDVAGADRCACERAPADSVGHARPRPIRLSR